MNDEFVGKVTVFPPIEDRFYIFFDYLKWEFLYQKKYGEHILPKWTFKKKSLH